MSNLQEHLHLIKDAINDCVQHLDEAWRDSDFDFARREINAIFCGVKEALGWPTQEEINQRLGKLKELFSNTEDSLKSARNFLRNTEREWFTRIEIGKNKNISEYERKIIEATQKYNAHYMFASPQKGPFSVLRLYSFPMERAKEETLKAALHKLGLIDNTTLHRDTEIIYVKDRVIIKREPIIFVDIFVNLSEIVSLTEQLTNNGILEKGKPRRAMIKEHPGGDMNSIIYMYPCENKIEQYIISRNKRALKSFLHQNGIE